MLMSCWASGVSSKTILQAANPAEQHGRGPPYCGLVSRFHVHPDRQNRTSFLIPKSCVSRCHQLFWFAYTAVPSLLCFLSLLAIGSVHKTVLQPVFKLPSVGSVACCPTSSGFAAVRPIQTHSLPCTLLAASGDSWAQCLPGAARRLHPLVRLVWLQPWECIGHRRLLADGVPLCSDDHPCCSSRLHHNFVPDDGSGLCVNGPCRVGCDCCREWRSRWTGVHHCSLLCGASLGLHRDRYYRWLCICGSFKLRSEGVEGEVAKGDAHLRVPPGCSALITLLSFWL